MQQQQPTFDPQVLAVRMKCPLCEEELTRATVAPLNQCFGPVVKNLRTEASHVVATYKTPEGLAFGMFCPVQRNAEMAKVVGPAAIGKAQVMAHDAAIAVAAKRVAK